MITKITMLIIMIIVVRVKNVFLIMILIITIITMMKAAIVKLWYKNSLFFSSPYPYVKFNCKDYILLTEKATYICLIFEDFVYGSLVIRMWRTQKKKKKAIITVKFLSLHFLLQRITYINWLKLFFDNSASLKTSKFNFFLKINLSYFCFCITRIRE